MIGSNDWFRWLEDFERRHPVEVSQLTEPLPTRACRVLWNRDEGKILPGARLG
jgi:hypothetical protein